MPYKIALLDDDAPQLQATGNLVNQLLQREGLDAAVMPYHSAFDVPSLSYDAYLLDISMPGMDGIALAARIRSAGSAAPIIFITGIENRVFEAIRVQPLRFVRKARLAQELPEAMRALCDQLRREEESALPLQTDGMLLRVPVREIQYVESSDKNQRVVLSQRQYEVRSTMAYFEEHLLPRGLMRIHRCYLVNLQAVYSIEGSAAVLADGTRLPISRMKVAEVKNEFKRMMFRE